MFDLANFYLEKHKYIHNGYVYFEINKGMYGVPQAGKLQMTNSLCFSNLMVTTNPPSHLDNGSMKLETFPSALSSMILE